jgi:phosphoribosylaminoimidazole-succinocarboxamide synthase
MTYDEVVDTVGPTLAAELRDVTLRVYARGLSIAAEAGIILADTKVELGLLSSELVLGDEVLTPDSSRFWPAASWHPGRAQPSYDKQFVRDWLTASGWDKQAPGPVLPDEVVEKTRAKYVEAYEVLTGSSFDSYLRNA